MVSEGFSLVQVTKFSCGKRWHIFPAYAQNGIMPRRVYQGLTDSDLFEDLIAQLLHHCSRYPEPKICYHYGQCFLAPFREKTLQMCRDAGVVLEFLSPYSPDFNPIEEHFGVLKKFIKKKWHENEDFIAREFKTFSEWCVRCGR